MTFNLYNNIILAGIVQGVVLSVIVVCSKKYRAPATLFLCGFMLSFSMDNLQYYLVDIGLLSDRKLMETFFVPFEFISGPMFLFYGRFLIAPGRVFRRRDLLWWLPFALTLILTTVFKISDAYVKPGAFTDDLEETLEFLAIAFDTVILTIMFFECMKAQRKGNLTAEILSRIKWLKAVVLFLFFLSAIWLWVTVADYYFDTGYWYAVYIGMVVAVYWVGNMGIYRFGQELKVRKAVADRTTADRPRHEHIRSLENLVERQKRFLDPTLSLEQIAAEMNLSQSHLSRIINAELGMKFPDYLNALRVEQAKSFLRDPEFGKYTLAAIGIEAGFNSKTTFYTAFKKHTLLTPSAYRESAVS